MGALFSSSQPKHIRVHFSSSPATVLAKVTRDSKSTETRKTSLQDLFHAKCTAIFVDFVPTWWLFNGHLQTLYCVLGKFTDDPIEYTRTYLRLLDGGTIGLDSTPKKQESVAPNAPIIVVLHGLTGGSYESYVRSILYPACTPVQEGGLGYRGIVVNFRGCAKTPITSPQLYSAGETGDIRQVLIYIRYTYPDAPLIGLGFSLGANVLTRYLAEEGFAPIFRMCTGLRGSSFSTSYCQSFSESLKQPWNLRANNDALNQTFLGRNVYSKGMGGNLVNLVKTHKKAIIECDTQGNATKALADVLSLKSPALDEFDGTFTRVAGGTTPPFPFKTANDYYDWGSSHYVVNQIRVPFLAINSADDPVVQDVPLDAGDNEYAVMALTQSGGHLGWFESLRGKPPTRWIVRPVLDWLQLVAEDLVHDRIRGAPIIVREDGFLMQEGRNDIGCKCIDIVENVQTDRSSEGLLQGL